MGAVRVCAGNELRRHWRAHLALVVLVVIVGGTVLAVAAGARRDGLGVAEGIVVPGGELAAAAAVTLVVLTALGLLAGARAGRRHPAQALRAE